MTLLAFAKCSVLRLSMRGRHLRPARLLVSELAEELLEPLGNALPYHVIVDPLQDIPKSALVFAAETSSSFTYNMGIRLHRCLWPS
jgi:hypothetical protein